MENINHRANGLGIAGFCIALVAIPCAWIPVFGWVITTLGLILSAIAIRNKPRGLAISGLVLSLVSIAISISIIAATATLFGGVTKGLLDLNKSIIEAENNTDVKQSIKELETGLQALATLGENNVITEISKEKQNHTTSDNTKQILNEFEIALNNIDLEMAKYTDGKISETEYQLKIIESSSLLVTLLGKLNYESISKNPVLLNKYNTLNLRYLDFINKQASLY